jgi:ribosomal protein L37E
MRDFVLFRIQVGGHPRRPNETCWPLLDFQSAIDDHLLEITHIIRGVDLQASTEKQKLLYNYFGWQYPDVEYWGRVEMLEESIDPKTGDVLRNQDGDVVYVPISFSSSAYAKGIQEGYYDDWADPRLYTVQGMKNRGYSPEAITQWWKDMGMTNRNIKAPLTTLDSLNSQFMKAETVKEYNAEQSLYWSHKRDKECSYCGHGKNHKAALLSDDGKLFGCYKCNSYPNEEEMVADFESETFEADELGDATYDSNCLICARPFGDGFGLWANRQTFEYLQDKYESATKEAANNAFLDLAKSQGVIIERLEDLVNFKNSVPNEIYDNIIWTSENTLYSKTNPFGVRKTGRTLTYWWLIKTPVTLFDGTEVQGYYLDALNAYMSQYLVGGKKRSNIAMQVESFLRDVLVVPGGIGANIMDIQDFGIPSATRRIPAFNPRFLDEFAASGATVNPPPPPSDITDDDCIICGRAFVWSPLAQAIQLKYYESSDGGEIDLKTQKMMPEDESLSRTTVNIVGRYLFNYQGGALSQYFANTKKPSNKVINLLRLALVPSITVNREMFQLVKDLQFREETPFKFPTAFTDEWQAESWTGKCQRCGDRTSQNYKIMSWFNTDLICMDCADKETKHPKFQEAKDRENEEVRKGNLNYEGIGFEAESFDADLTSIKSAETLEAARIAVSNYSSDNTFLNENLTFLASIMDYDYGSGKNSEFEIYGAPTIEDVQKFAESLVNIQRFMGE